MKRWSRSHEACVQCGTKSHPHEGLGLCGRCYDKRKYANNIVKERARRKAQRIANGTVEKRYPKVRQWHIEHAERVKAHKAEWHSKHGPKPKWPIGMKVRVLVGKKRPHWEQGDILEKPSNCTVRVKLASGTVLVSTAKQARIMSESDFQLSRELKHIFAIGFGESSVKRLAAEPEASQ